MIAYRINYRSSPPKIEEVQVRKLYGDSGRAKNWHGESEYGPYYAEFLVAKINLLGFYHKTIAHTLARLNKLEEERDVILQMTAVSQ